MSDLTIPLWPDGCSHNVEGPRGLPRLEVFQTLPENHPARPAVIVCPGGGYGGLSPHEGLPLAQLFAVHGMVGIVCYYRVAPNRFPGPQADVMRAVRLVRSMSDPLGVDPNRIALMGFSAGGHNAATVATQPDVHHDEHDDLVGQFSARPDRLILGYPVISFGEHGHMGSANNLLGEDATDEQRRALSNELHVTADNPPTFIFHTSSDQAVPIENALMFASALSAAKVPCELHAYEFGPHGVGMALNNPKLRSWSGLLIDWLREWSADPA